MSSPSGSLRPPLIDVDLLCSSKATQAGNVDSKRAFLLAPELFLAIIMLYSFVKKHSGFFSGVFLM